MGELFAIIKWLAMILALSAVMRPCLQLKNLKFADEGFSISFSLGTALSFFLAFIIAAVTPIDYGTPVCYISVVIFLLAEIFIKRRFGKKSLPEFDKSKIKRYLLGFLAFSIIFLICVYVKGFKPEISYDTEKYMDFGFMQGIYRQRRAIPEDIWFLGKKLNYYYLGQSCAVFLCRLAFITPEYGYNFMLCTLLAASALMIFTMVDAFIKAAFCGGEKGMPALLGGITASALATLGGNGHYLIYGIGMPILEKVTGRSFRYNDYGYFFPDSTVYIGTNPDVPDKGKHEFLAYTLVLGDLHAHAMNVIFVLPLIAILLDYGVDAVKVKSEKDTKARALASDKKGALKRTLRYLIPEDILDPRFLLIGVLLGLFRGTNYWDFPIYFVISGAVILFCDLSRKGVSVRTVINVLVKGAYILIIGTVLIIPFSNSFVKMASKVCIAQNHSPFYKMVILWGLPVICGVTLLIYLAVLGRKTKMAGEYLAEDGSTTNEWDLAPVLTMTAIVLCAIGLIIVPEVIYIKDIYGDEYARFNTMFKLTYQAFTLFAITAGVSVGVYLKRGVRYAAIIILCISAILSTYMFTAVHQFMGNVLKISQRKGISSIEALYNDPELLAEANAVSYLSHDRSRTLHVLEASGDSYSPDDKISVFTGSSTYVGWNVHEWMWRNDWDIVGARVGEIVNFYSLGDEEYCREFIKSHRVDYIFVGPREVEKMAVNTAGFENLCEKIEISDNKELGLYRVK